MTRLGNAARVAFCLYAVFMLVGAAPPFGDETPEERTSSNPINQVVDTVIPVAAIVCMWPKRRRALSLLKREKYLALFILWCATTVLWSDFPFSSGKAAIRLIGSTIVVLAFLVNVQSSSDALRYLRIIFAIYVPATLVSVALIPGAVQPDSDAWRGLAVHKNTLGEIALVAAIVWCSALAARSKRERGVAWIFVTASLVLLFGSRSVTSIIVFVLLVMLVLWSSLSRRLGGWAAAFAMGACCVFGVLILVNTAGLESSVTFFGKDATFTGRTDIWSAMVQQAVSHPLMGAGFAGFWTPENEDPLSYTSELGAWSPTAAHQGYIDLWNEIGAIGIVLLIMMAVFYFHNLSELNRPCLWKWLIIAILLINVMESTLFRPASFTGWIFVLSYLALYMEVNVQRFSAWRTEIAGPSLPGRHTLGGASYLPLS